MSAAIDPRSIKRLQRKLDQYGKKAQRASATAANRAARSTVAEFSRETRKEVPVKAGRLKKMARISKAGSGRQAAKIIVTGAHVPLADMGARQNRKGVTVRTTRTSGRKLIKRAFIERMPSGHRGVYQRTGKARLPIQEKFGPSGMGLWQHREQHLQRFGQRQLAKELKRALQYSSQRRG